MTHFQKYMEDYWAITNLGFAEKQPKATLRFFNYILNRTWRIDQWGSHGGSERGSGLKSDITENMDKILKKYPGPGIRTRDLSNEKPGLDDFTTERIIYTDRF